MESTSKRISFVPALVQNQRDESGIDEAQGRAELNAAKIIRNVKAEMVSMQQLGGHRDWGKWKELKQNLAVEYMEEEVYWKQKSTNGSKKVTKILSCIYATQTEKELYG